MKKPKLTECAIIDQIEYKNHTITVTKAWDKRRTHVETYYGVSGHDDDFTSLSEAKAFIDQNS